MRSLPLLESIVIPDLIGDPWSEPEATTGVMGPGLISEDEVR